MSEKIDLSKYVLSEDDEFMNASQRAYFRAKLVAWKNDILREARETLGHLAEESANHPDLADRITEFAGTVRDKTTNNAIKAARALVFGLLGAILGMVALVLTLIALTRGVQALLDLFTTWGPAVYISYFVIGGIFTLGGLFLMTKRTAR